MCFLSAPSDVNHQDSKNAAALKERRQAIRTWRIQLAKVQAEALSWTQRVVQALGNPANAMEVDLLESLDLNTTVRRLLLLDLNLTQYFTDPEVRPLRPWSPNFSSNIG